MENLLHGLPMPTLVRSHAGTNPGGQVLLGFHLARIRRVFIPAPSDLRDLVWVPAQFMWTNGGEASGHIPVRYSRTENAKDGALRLSRKTEWKELAEETYIGLGQRVLVTEEGEHPLLQCRTIDFSPV